MDNVFKKICILTISSFIFVVSISIIFFKGEMSSAKGIEDVDNLTGQKIGTVTAYEGDYVLSDRDDITLLRYDSEPDCLVALCYKQIDALAITEDGAKYVLSLSTGLKINDEPIGYTGLASIFTDNSELLDEYNEFINEFRKTDEYILFCEKADNGGFYDGSDVIEETGNGKTINVGYVQDYVPVVFYDTINHVPNGMEPEMIRIFANAKNYKINWVEITETSSYALLTGGDIDMAALGYSEIYRREFEASPLYEMSVSFRDTKVVLLEVEDYDNMSFTNFLKVSEEGE